MTRNAILIAALLHWTVWCHLVIARAPDDVPGVGILAVSAGPHDPAYQALRRGLQDLGLTEGRDYKIEHRSAEGHLDRLAILANQLVQLNVAVVVTGTPEATRAAKAATNTTPIVALLAGDPVAAGFIESFGHPGGNVTGRTVRTVELGGKYLELLKDLLPTLSRVAILWDTSTASQLEQIKQVAATLGVRTNPIELKARDAIESAFASAVRNQSNAMLVLPSPEMYVLSPRIGALAIRHRLVVISPFREAVVSGALMSYSSDVQDGFYRGAYFVSRILNGTKPADLPFEQSDDLRLVVNLKTAEVLGIQIPQSIRIRADEVLQ